MYISLHEHLAMQQFATIYMDIWYKLNFVLLKIIELKFKWAQARLHPQTT